MKKSFNKFFSKNDLLTHGNRKMTYSTFSLPVCRDVCVGSTALCRKYCYALTQQRMWKRTSDKRYRNLTLIENKSKFIDLISTEIDKRNPDAIRIHESGDFYSQHYFDVWIAITNEFRNKPFLAFTKNFNLRVKHKKDNFVLYTSVWPDTLLQRLLNNPEMKNLKKAYTLVNRSKYQKERYKKYNEAVKQLEDIVSCNGLCHECNTCFHNMSEVYFNLH